MGKHTLDTDIKLRDTKTKKQVDNDFSGTPNNPVKVKKTLLPVKKTLLPVKKTHLVL